MHKMVTIVDNDPAVCLSVFHMASLCFGWKLLGKTRQHSAGIRCGLCWVISTTYRTTRLVCIQEYLTRRYARSRAELPSLPYTTSGHTILKKSSTDPTSDHSVSSCHRQIKHATFCDIVIVVNSEVGLCICSVRLK